MNRLRVNLLRRIHWTKKDCLCWHFRGGIIQSFVFVVYVPSRRFSNVALSRLWHVMNQMITWNCHWMLGSRRHSMLRGIRLFFVCPLTFSSSFFVTHDRTYEENPPLLHSLEKWNSKLSCSLTSLICYESDDNLELWLNEISMPFTDNSIWGGSIIIFHPHRAIVRWKSSLASQRWKIKYLIDAKKKINLGVPQCCPPINSIIYVLLKKGTICFVYWYDTGDMN